MMSGEMLFLLPTNQNYYSMRNLLTGISLLFLFTSISSAQISLVPFATGASDPVDIKNCGDERLFVVEQRGFIYIYDTNGARIDTPFLDIQTRTRFGSEQGLLGLAFPSDFREHGYFYVNYTAQTRGNTRISRFRVSPLDSNRAEPSSEEILMELYQPYSNHNGGHLAFGADGYLYIGTGDGGSGGDPQNRAQNPDSLMGKFLRIEVDPSYPGYKIPPTNPFACSPLPGRDEVWSLGWRNPWRWSFDRATGDLWVGDVGQGAFEEVDFEAANAPGGLNYGWRCYEGNAVYNGTGCASPASYVAPVATTDHNSGVCSVIGGYVYRGSRYNDMYGKYFFTDYCSPVMYTLESDGAGGFINTTLGNLGGSSFAGFGEDMWGELYIGTLSTGTIYKFISNDCTPVATINHGLDTLSDCGQAPARLYVPAGRNFDYTWYRDGIMLASDSSEIMADSAGTYVVVVMNPATLCTNSDTLVLVNSAPLALNFSGLDTLYCIYNQSVNLQPSIPGGYFSGEGMECFSFNPALAGEGFHEITYTYESAQGCVYETSQTVRVDACLGITDNSWLKTFQVYPNPGDGSFTIDFESDRRRTVRLEIRSIVGQQLYSVDYEIQPGMTRIQPDLRLPDSGMYLLNFSDGNNFYIQKLLVN